MPRSENIKTIIEKAKTNLLAKNVNELLFDPQGRVLIDVELSEEDKSHTKITTVSLDIADLSEDIQNEYKRQYGLTEEQLQKISAIKDSIIPLQQEFHFHLALAARALNKKFPDRFSEKEMTIAHQEAIKTLQPSIQDAFKKALKKATSKNGAINDVRLIQELDKARKVIPLEAHKIDRKSVV